MEMMVLQLFKEQASYTVLDRVGDWGAEDPGDGWAVCGVADATKDNTLVKKSINMVLMTGQYQLVQMQMIVTGQL